MTDNSQSSPQWVSRTSHALSLYGGSARIDLFPYEIAPLSEWWRDARLLTHSDQSMKDSLNDAKISEFPTVAGDLFEALPVAVPIPA